MLTLEGKLKSVLNQEVQVELCAQSRIATFKVACGPANGALRAEQLESLKRSAKALEAVPWVNKVLVIYPNLYLDLRTDDFSAFLSEELERLTRENVPLINAGENRLCNISCCSPNANKPLHLGHARNLSIGGALSKIFEAAGYRVEMTALFSDYGIHISRAVAAYVEDGARATPETLGLKGDHLVGYFYTEGSKRAASEGDEAESFRTLERKLLSLYIQGDAATRETFGRLTGWAISGIRQTFERFGSSFQRFFWESDSVELCKEIVRGGLVNNTLVKHDDGSVWAAAVEHDENAILMRGDGSPLYLLQSIASSVQRNQAYGADLDLYISIRAFEQVSHFSLYREVWDALGYPPQKGRHVVAYGLVYDGTERMRSRAGTVVTIDYLLDEIEEELKVLLRGCDIETSFAGVLSVGMLRTYLLAHPLDKPVHFEKDDLVRGRGRLYLQACSVLQRADLLVRGAEASEPPEHKRQELLKELQRLAGVVEHCVRRRDPTPMITYLRQLCERSDNYLGGRGRLTGLAAEARMLTFILNRVLRLLDLPHPQDFIHVPQPISTLIKF